MEEYITLIKEPRKFFKSVAKEDISVTLKKTVPIVLVLHFVHLVLVFSSFEKAMLFPLRGVGGILFFALMVLILPIALLVSASLLHLALKILKVKSVFSQNIKIMIYPMVPFALFYIILDLFNVVRVQDIYLKIALAAAFFILFMALFVWQVVLNVKGISEIYKISSGRALAAYLLIYGMIFGAILAIIILILITAVVFLLIAKGAR